MIKAEAYRRRKMIDFEIDEISSSSFTVAQSYFTMRCLTPPFGMISVACSSSFCGPRNFISKVETHPSAGTIKALSAAIQLLEILVRFGATTLRSPHLTSPPPPPSFQFRGEQLR